MSEDQPAGQDATSRNGTQGVGAADTATPVRLRAIVAELADRF